MGGADMISCRKSKDGFEEIVITGERSHLETKALQSLLGKICGRGKVQGVIGQSNVRIVVVNDGTTGSDHQAIEER